MKKFNIKYKFNYQSKNMSKNIIGDNSLLKKTITYKPKKNIFIAAEELFRLV